MTEPGTCFAYCSDCQTLWLNVSGHAVAHACSGREPIVSRVTDIFDRSRRWTRRDKPRVDIPTQWATAVVRCP